jgi:ABC-type phosphate/phosphonate transport system substrate-binding protein
LVLTLGLVACRPTEGKPAGRTVAMVVMDPLAKQLACPCVAGYAQRDYRRLAAFLGNRLGSPVEAVFAEDLDKALRQTKLDQVALVIGKPSVVRHDATSRSLPIRPLCQLTAKDGSTTLKGLFIVSADDQARSVSDLRGRRILFGSADADEKHAAALAALAAAGNPRPGTVETREGCSDAAMEITTTKERPAPAAVISSYALPLLEGCGNIDKGALRVIGETGPVPFVTVFATDAITPTLEPRWRAALEAVRQDPGLLKALESKDGFVPAGSTTTNSAPGSAGSARADWPDFRGPTRDGCVPRLPERLPATAKFLWEKPLVSAGLAGLTVAESQVIVADRDLTDTQDVFHGLKAEDGASLWTLAYPAAGKLDYGLSPRATPVVQGGRAWLLGAFGHLHCVAMADGKIIWKKHLPTDFGTKPPKWGYASTPLLLDGRLLIVNPGAPKAALAALDPATGEIVWKTPGAPAAYASFILGNFGGKTQIVGYDAHSLGGWEVETGKRLWTLTPAVSGDFNVPTPLAVGDKLLVATENNAARLYSFKPDGTPEPKPAAEFADLAPETVTPVFCGGRVLGARGGLFCLDPANDLKPAWTVDDPVFAEHVSLLAAPGALLAASYRGELLLLSVAPDAGRIVSRLRVFDAESEVYAHPALVEDRLYLRNHQGVVCLDLRL